MNSEDQNPYTPLHNSIHTLYLHFLDVHNNIRLSMDEIEESEIEFSQEQKDLFIKISDDLQKKNEEITKESYRTIHFQLSRLMNQMIRECIDYKFSAVAIYPGDCDTKTWTMSEIHTFTLKMLDVLYVISQIHQKYKTKDN